MNVSISNVAEHKTCKHPIKHACSDHTKCTLSASFLRYSVTINHAEGFLSSLNSHVGLPRPCLPTFLKWSQKLQAGRAPKPCRQCYLRLPSTEGYLDHCGLCHCGHVLGMEMGDYTCNELVMFLVEASAYQPITGYSSTTATALPAPWDEMSEPREQ